MKFIPALVLSFATGFIFLSFEILWIRVFSFASKSDPKIFGIVLGIYLLGIGIGVGVTKRFVLLGRDKTVRLLSTLLLIASVTCYLVIPATGLISSWWFYAWKYGLVFVLIAATSFGGIFPLIVSSAVADDRHTGKRVALIYAANITGSTAGTLTTGYILLNHASIGTIATLMTVACLLLSLVISIRRKTGTKTTSRWLPVVILLSVLLMSHSVHRGIYEKLKYMPRSRLVPPFTDIIENRNGVITVTEDKTVFGNGAYDGVISTSLSPKKNHEIENAYLAFLFHRAPRDILEIGLSTGSWAQVLANGPGVESLTSVEINPGYLSLIRKHPEVKSLLSHPKFTPVVDDGRRWLRRNRDKSFDLIMMNTTFHWRNHATDLLSDEFIKLVKSRLNPGGVIYLNTTRSKEAMRTVAVNFKYTLMYRIYIIASDSPFEIDRDRFRKTLAEYTIDGRKVLDLSHEKDRKVVDYLSGLKFRGDRDELLTKTEGTGIITDDNMVTEFKFSRR